MEIERVRKAKSIDKIQEVISEELSHNPLS